MAPEVLNYLLIQINPVCLNSLGLFLDVIAGLLIWKFGLPEDLNKKGESSLLLEGTDEEEIKKAKKYDNYSKLGISLLILGFILQLLSNYI